jgi:carbohydrate-selective porin OprB
MGRRPREALTAIRWLLLAAVLLALARPGTAAAQTEPVSGSRDELDRRQLALPTPRTEFLSINGSVLGTIQWIANAGTAQGWVFGAGSLDLNVIVRPSDTVRLFLDVEGLLGPGPDQRLGTLSRLNTDAERLEDRDKAFVIRELFLRATWLEERVRFSIGKLDVGHYFDRNFLAEDETSQFLDNALINNPMLKPPPNGPGAALRVSMGDWRLAFGVHAPGDVDDDLSGLPYIIGELGRRNIFSQRGHYRWWARVSSVPDQRDRVTWATGVSIDQLVSSEVGVFLRAGLSRSQGDDLTSHAWSTGVQITPTWLGRPRDRFGAGYSAQREGAGRERMVETYYNLALADWLFLIGNLQWVVSGPNQVTGGMNRNVVVPGLRALVLF